MREKNMMRGSMTVEMSLLMPLILLLVMGCILAVFYYHDKNIISGAAYETVVVGSTKAREKNGVKNGEVQALFRERVSGKCILFPEPSSKVDITEDEVTITVNSGKGRMKLAIVKRARITEPEKYIRDRKRITGKWNESSQ